MFFSLFLLHFQKISKTECKWISNKAKACQCPLASVFFAFDFGGWCLVIDRLVMSTALQPTAKVRLCKYFEEDERLLWIASGCKGQRRICLSLGRHFYLTICVAATTRDIWLSVELILFSYSLSLKVLKKCKCVSGWGINQSLVLASVSWETKVCLCASITLAHESRHLLEKKILSLSPSLFQGNTLNQHPGYKFAKRNTGLIVCWVDAGCIRIDPGTPSSLLLQIVPPNPDPHLFSGCQVSKK